MICRDPCIGAAGQTAPTNGLQPLLKMFFDVVQHASVKERFQYYKRQDICLLFILVLYDTIDRYIVNLKAGKKMKCATWANGRRATHEQRRQKDLNELPLPLQFTQSFSFQYT